MTKDTQGVPEGHVVVTWDQDRTRILAVTRQDDDGHILSVIAEVPATDVELERQTGEPHIDGWPLFSGLPLPATPAFEAPAHAPEAGPGEKWEADVECITDESGTDYSVSIRGPGLRNPDYSDVWMKKRPAEQLVKWLNKSVLARFNVQVPAVAHGHKVTPYEPTQEMIGAVKRFDPALPLEHIRAIWWAMWGASNVPVQHPKEHE